MWQTIKRRLSLRFVLLLVVAIILGIVAVYNRREPQYYSGDPLLSARNQIEDFISQWAVHIFVLVALVILFLGIGWLVVAGYKRNWIWTGFGSYSRTKGRRHEYYPAKTLWDWMQLLIIPITLTAGVLSFNYWNTATQNAITTDNQRQVVLQEYIDRMSDLILEKGLLTTVKSDDEIRIVARTRTFTVLHMLDGTRKGLVLQFLSESGLINTPAVISLNGADFSNAKLPGAKLTGADLNYANFSNSYLPFANLTNANLGDTLFDNSNLTMAAFRGANLQLSSLSSAQLSSADFSNARLTGATFVNANLRGAKFNNANLEQASLRGADLASSNLTSEQLGSVFSLRGATLPDGSRR